MAKKRMLSLQIVDTDAFLDMPLSTQALYFHLVMRADDEGFIDNPKKIIRLISCQEDDYKVLISKRFILTFESGIIVIKHWLIHNTIRMDRFNKTVYCEEKESLILKKNKAYTDNGNQMATSGEHKLSKVKLSKVNTTLPKARANNKFPSNDYIEIIACYESLKGVNFSGNEYKPIQQAIKSMFMSKRTKDQIIKCMETLNNSELAHWQSWNINTVQKQIPLFVSGKLTF